MYELKTPLYSGPLEKLLELIEERQLDITEVNLAEVTGDFLKYLDNLKKQSGPRGVSPRLIADFVVVAAKMLLIKSKTLLPNLILSTEEEEEIRDLEDRLRLYRLLKSVLPAVRMRWDSPPERFFNRALYDGRPPVFCPPPNLSVAALRAAAAALSSVQQKKLKEEKLPPSSLISIADKIRELLARLQNDSQLSLLSLTEKKQRSEIIAVFLAILHLIYDQVVDFEQPEPFGDVIIKK